MRRIHPQVEEAVETLDLNPVTRRRLLTGTGLASASLAATALLEACSSKAETSAGAVGNFPKTPNWKFVFVCHVTTNPFFTPTQYGAADASKLLGVSYQWTGSKTRSGAEMANGGNPGSRGKAEGLPWPVAPRAASGGRTASALD